MSSHPIPIPSPDPRVMGPTAASILALTAATPQYNITITTASVSAALTAIEPYLQAIAAQLAADYPIAGAANNWQQDGTRVHWLLAELRNAVITAAGG